MAGVEGNCKRQHIPVNCTLLQGSCGCQFSLVFSALPLRSLRFILVYKVLPQRRRVRRGSAEKKSNWVLGNQTHGLSYTELTRARHGAISASIVLVETYNRLHNA